MSDAETETKAPPKHPYCQPFHEWSPEVLAAYQSFPKGPDGFNLQLTASTEREWREWCRNTPEHLWPIWVHQYAANKKRAAESGRARSLGLRK